MADIRPVVSALCNLMEVEIQLEMEKQKRMPAGITGSSVIPQVIKDLQTKVIGAQANLGVAATQFNTDLAQDIAASSQSKQQKLQP